MTPLDKGRYYQLAELALRSCGDDERRRYWVAVPVRAVDLIELLDKDKQLNRMEARNGNHVAE